MFYAAVSRLKALANLPVQEVAGTSPARRAGGFTNPPGADGISAPIRAEAVSVSALSSALRTELKEIILSLFLSQQFQVAVLE